MLCNIKRQKKVNVWFLALLSSVIGLSLSVFVPVPADVASLYTQAVQAAQNPHKLQKKTEQKVLL